MRKKYLSALLFGALLFASAGTFTSCKDYDDDINNLQEQINTINTTLADLKNQISDKGVSSVTFDEATGVLTVVDGNGTNTYKITTDAAEAVNIEIKDGHLYVDGEDKGVVGGGSVVTVDENGVLNIDGEPAGLEVGSKVVIAEVAGTYQLTVDGQTITLPTATSVGLTEISNAGNNWTINNNYAWASATTDIEWDGPMGDVKTGDLLIGGLASSYVKVTPISYDLGAQELSLIDQYGGKAPVKITAYGLPQAGVTSRASSHNGIWMLTLAMDDTVTAENIATAFTKKVNGVDMNLKYALAVNGVAMTGYDYVIDTQTESESKANVAINKDNLDVVSTSTGAYNYVAIGGDVLYLAGVDINRVVDSYIKFEGLAASQAEAMGVTAEGMQITAPATAAGKSITGVSVYILDVTGKITKKEVDLNIASSSASTTETASPVAIKITTDNTFTIDLGTIFQNLDANIVLNAKYANLTTVDRNFFAQRVSDNHVTGLVANSSGIKFKKSDNKDVTFGQDLRSVTKAVVTLPIDSCCNYRSGATDIANIYGAFNLELTLNDNLGNELKKIVVPVTVSKPEFSDYYTENNYAGWENGTAKHVLTDIKSVSLSNQLFNINKKSDGQTDMITGQPSYTVTYTGYDNKEQKNINFTAVNLTDDTYKVLKADGHLYDLKVSSLKAKANKAVAHVKLTEANGELATAATDINVDKEFTLKLVSQFADVKVVYYNNNTVSDKAIVVDNLIAGYKNTAATDEAANYNGLAFQYGTANLEVKKNASASTSYKLNGFSILTATNITAAANNNQVKVAVSKSGTSLGGTPVFATSGVTITDLNAGEGGKLTFTFVDDQGIKTTASIDYIKQ